MSGKSELLTLTPLISARFYLRPGFFDPVASKELKYCASPLDATHTRWYGSVASKGLRSRHNYGNGIAHFSCARPGLRMPCVATTTDGKAPASCRTPNKKRQPRLPLLEPGRSLTWD